MVIIQTGNSYFLKHDQFTLKKQEDLVSLIKVQCSYRIETNQSTGFYIKGKQSISLPGKIDQMKGTLIVKRLN